MINAIIVLGTWSSGSTAVTGYLERCGGYTCPPHQHTNDERTPIAYEPLAYAEALRTLFDEFSLKKVGKTENFIDFFEDFWAIECVAAKRKGLDNIVLKHPLQTFILPYLKNRLNPSFVFVTRPFEKIERSRARRDWHPVYGSLGAKAVYSTAFNFLIENSCPFITVPYEKFLTDKFLREKMLSFLNISPSDKMKENAAKFVRAPHL
jgi:hypothetical protein